METKIEKERRWLLKRVPDFEKMPKVLLIAQFYTEDGWRYRITIDTKTQEEKCVKLRKVAVGNGINHEIDIQDITEEDLKEVAERNEKAKWIEKTRFVYDYNGKTFEVDDFSDLDLVILEVEDVDMEDNIDFPESIKCEIITEITGQSVFSNYNLADNVEKHIHEL